MRVVTIGVLGPTLVEHNGAPVEAGPLRQRALLTLLALNAGRTVPLEAVVDALWDKDAPDRAEVSVRSYVSNLRRVLEPERAPGRTCDAAAHERNRIQPRSSGRRRRCVAVLRARDERVQAERAGDTPGAVDAATRALQCWRGPALVDVQSAPFAIGVATRSMRTVTGRSSCGCAAWSSLGRYSEALRQLEARVDDDNARRSRGGAVDAALYAVGRSGRSARTRYGALREPRSRNGGLLPRPMLQDLEACDPASRRSTEMRRRSNVTSSAARLPKFDRQSSVVGRHRGLDTVVATLVRQARLRTRRLGGAARRGRARQDLPRRSARRCDRADPCSGGAPSEMTTSRHSGLWAAHTHGSRPRTRRRCGRRSAAHRRRSADRGAGRPGTASCSTTCSGQTPTRSGAAASSRPTLDRVGGDVRPDRAGRRLDRPRSKPSLAEVLRQPER